jgi:hypothetical protein
MKTYKEKIILADRSDFRQTESEEQYEFTKYVLSSIGLPDDLIADVLPEYKDFTVDLKIKLREVLKKFNVSIVDDRDGGIQYYVDNEPVAEWRKPFFKIVQNTRAKGISERTYIEIHCKFWLISEN